MTAAWDIAHIVERASAADRVRIRGRRRGQSMKDAVASEYDPLAATCLALLIESRLAAPASDSTAGYEPEASEPKDAARRDEGAGQ